MAISGQGSLSARQPEKARLPKLQGIVNRRAQQIIMDHMHCSATEASFSSTATMPVLLQIDNTAPRTARTHDISHLLDQKAYLAPNIPESLIDEADHIYETGFLPKDSSSVYREQDGLWYTKVFPSNTPSNRDDAVRLDAWVTKTLDKYKKAGAGRGKEDLAQAVEDLVPILSVGLHEIVRQVTHHCPERGTVLEKIWRTYVELFDRVLREMQAALKKDKQKTFEIHEVLMETKTELECLRNSHPEQMQDVIGQLEEQFTEKQKKVEEELQQSEEENSKLKQELRQHHNELELWYPSFPLYQDSYLKNHIPQYSHHAQSRVPLMGKKSVEEEEAPAEVAIAEDFKRLLAVLAPEKRQAIGKELTYVLKTASIATKHQDGKKHGHKTRLSQLVADGQRCVEREAKLAALHEEVAKQEMKIQDLKDTVKELERQGAAANSIIEDQVSAIKDGQDGDGLSLDARRGTSNPGAMTTDTTSIGTRGHL